MTTTARLARRARRKAERSRAKAERRALPVARAPNPQAIERRRYQEAFALLGQPLPKWRDPSLAQDENGAFVIMDGGRHVAWMSAKLASQLLPAGAVLVENEGQDA